MARRWIRRMMMTTTTRTGIRYVTTGILPMAASQRRDKVGVKLFDMGDGAREHEPPTRAGVHLQPVAAPGLARVDLRRAHVGHLVPAHGPGAQQQPRPGEAARVRS